jgi:hypothetical protein
MGDDKASEWVSAMRALDFERAWRINDADMGTRRMPKHTGPRHLQRIWNGEPLHDVRVLVRCYHGLGDTLQYIRFAAALRRLARDVSVWAQPSLMELVAQVTGVDRVLPLHDGTPEVDFDVDIEVMELAHALRVRPADVEACVPYLRVPSVASASLRREMGTLHVGLVWEAGDWDARRSLRPQDLMPLARLDRVKLYALRPESDIGPLPAIDIASHRIETLAANMLVLDAIVAVDTMAAHLAGGLGLPVFTLLQKNCDWRWGKGADSTPWYPTMRLFRQESSDDWRGPVSRLVDAIEARAHGLVRART